MPPKTPNKLAMPKTGGELALTRGDEKILSIFDSEGWGSALIANDFEQARMVEILMEGMDSPDIKDRLQSIRMFWNMSKEIAKLQGLIVDQNVQVQGTDAQGRKATMSASAQRLVQKVSQENTNDNPDDNPFEVIPAHTPDSDEGLQDDRIVDSDAESPTGGPGDPGPDDR